MNFYYLAIFILKFFLFSYFICIFTRLDSSLFIFYSFWLFYFLDSGFLLLFLFIHIYYLFLSLFISLASVSLLS